MTVAESPVAGVEGWLTPAQARVLATHAHLVDPGGRIVEIGSFRGRSTIAIASAAAEGVEVIAVDPHAGNDRGPREIEGFSTEAESDYEVFHRNLREAGVEQRVRHLRVPSLEALNTLPGPVDMVFVDGAHRYRPAVADLRGWAARVSDGGALLVHDAFSSVGVTLAIARALMVSRSFRYEGRTGSLAVFRRAPVTGAARLGNVARQLAQLPWFAVNLIRKALIVLHLRSGDWPY